MIESLNKYSKKGQFSFSLHQSLKDVCNAPIDKSGIYIIYGHRKNLKELIYIGISGKLNSDQTMFVRKAGLGGIKDRIVNGHQFGKVPRRISWPNQMRINGIEKLEIFWFATHDNILNDCPRTIEYKLLKNHLEMYNRLPIWNKEL